ncbi:MAG: BLUF domain-containing protein [Chthoniobacterales bacterium]
MKAEIYYLVYISTAIKLFKDEDLMPLLDQSRRYNQERGISGLLLYAEGCFIQIIEGQKQRVKNLFSQKICKDARHHSMILMVEGSEPDRSFPEWSMGFQSMRRNALSSNIPGFTKILGEGNSPHESYPEVSAKILALLKSFYKTTGLRRHYE